MSTLLDIWNIIQIQLFPAFEQELDPLTEKEKEFIKVVSLELYRLRQCSCIGCCYDKERINILK
jgi:hypothetical protein